MKQILQSMKTGKTEVADVPAPRTGPGACLMQTSVTLISAGTERMLVEFGRANLLDKARQQPERVRMVLDKIRTDGLGPTVDAVRNKLDQPLALGYCNVGVVRQVGAGVTEFHPGDRVASNGKHAEMVSVPRNLCAKVPDGVSDAAAAFTVLGAIALQGVRLVMPSLGEAVVVTGLGLVGLLTVQLLRAHGCRVLGLDFDPARLELARQFGAEVIDLGAGQDPVAGALHFSRGRGVDAVIITASTKSNEPVHQAALMCRQRGRIVLVGVTGLELSRDDFFKKELTFQVSASYGPGRYDPAYEDEGHDYPVGFVRWTAQRNFEAVLDMLADGRLRVDPLISHRFTIDAAPDAYALIAGDAPSLGVLLSFPGDDDSVGDRTVVMPSRATAVANQPGSSEIGVSAIGAGQFATAVLLPALARTGASMQLIASSTGVSGVYAARKFGFRSTTTDTAQVFDDAATRIVVITTRHDSHARFVMQGLEAGKHVFVEKPLCLTRSELTEIRSAYEQAHLHGDAPLLMVGFNRRFAPHITRIETLLAAVPGPKAFVMTVNAGAIPADHWTQNPASGGGRIAGEGCHFIDLLRCVARSPITSHHLSRMASPTGDTVSIHLTFADGSLGTVLYLANGSKQFPKERLEVFAAGRVLQLDNFRTLRAFGWPGFRQMKLWRQDKGHAACSAAFVNAVRTGGASPIPFDELLEVARVTIDLAAQP